MSFLSRRVLRLPTLYFRNTASRTQNLLNVTSKRFNSTATNTADVAPTFVQKPPAWVRFAWPIIIANALLMGSAIEITWNHWATLVKDLEAVAEKNRQDAAIVAAGTAVGTTPPPPPPAPATIQREQKDQETFHWERKPTWQRAAFCGIYALGWAFSSAYLLKYRQTYVTRLKFFRAPAPAPAPAPLPSTTQVTVPKQKLKLKRMIHISTASNSTGITIPLNSLVIQDGRNETELVIRAKDLTDETGQVVKRRRENWFVSLTDAVVDGARFSSHESARDRVLYAWDGIGPGNGGGGSGGGNGSVLSGFRSGPVVRD